MLAAVAKDGYALGFASEQPKADREVVLAAVAQTGHALQFASEQLEADREFMLRRARRLRAEICIGGTVLIVTV